jgi:hypothetical protein
MRDTNNGGWVLDASAHLLSRTLVSQTASITCCTLARVVMLFVSHVNIVFVVCVNIMLTKSKLLVFSTVGGERRRRQVLHRQPKSSCIKYSVTSSVKQAPACQSTTLPKLKTLAYLFFCATCLRSCLSVCNSVYNLSEQGVCFHRYLDSSADEKAWGRCMYSLNKKTSALS